LKTTNLLQLNRLLLALFAAAGAFADTLSVVAGDVVCWGSNSLGQTNAPSEATNVTAVAGGGNHSLALRADKRVLAWGDNAFGQCDVPAGASNVIAITAGRFHSLALREQGTVLAWGANEHGQGTVPGDLVNIVDIAAGGLHNLALRLDGTVVAWGDQTNVPAGLGDVVAIAAGSFHSVALKRDGTVLAWGKNDLGQTNIPAGLNDVVAISAGGDHSLALTGQGRIIGWGDNGSGQAYPPWWLWGGSAIAAGSWHSLALMPEGQVIAWGTNANGEASVPSGLKDVIAIAAGGSHSLAIVGTGAPVIAVQPLSRKVVEGSSVTMTAVAVGRIPLGYQWQFDGNDLAGGTDPSLTLANVQATAGGEYRVLISNGLGSVLSAPALLQTIPSPPVITLQPRTQTVPPTGGTAVFTVAARGTEPFSYQWQRDGTNIVGATLSALSLPNAQDHVGTYRVKVSNRSGLVTSSEAILGVVPVVAWGYNGYGECDVPLSATNLVQVAAGGDFNVGLRADGTALAWGRDGGRCNVPVWATNLVSVSAGLDHTLALGADGKVIAWGYDDFDQLKVPPSATNVTAVAAGSWSSLALKSDGTVVAWGYDGNGQRDVPGNVTNVVAIAAHAGNNMALRADGTVVVWGNSFYNQNQIPAEATNVVAIEAGFGFCLALRADGEIVAWGNDESGQLRVPPAAGNAVAIAAGDQHSLALQRGGTVIAWGNRTDGECDVPASVVNGITVVAGGSHSMALLGNGIPSFALQPLSRKINEGDPVRFTAFASGAGELTYQWQLNGSDINGETDMNLSIKSATWQDRGKYQLLARNALGTTASRQADLLVNLPPVADAGATPAWVVAADDLNAKVPLDGTRSSDLNGDPLAFSWFCDNSRLPSAAGAVASVILPKGAHRILLVVSDGILAGTNSVSVDVLTVSQAIQVLSAAVEASVHSRVRPLLATLEAALDSINRTNRISTVHQLEAFQKKLRAQVASFDPTLAGDLGTAADRIITALESVSTARTEKIKLHPPAHQGRLTFSAAKGRVYFVEASSDLLHWQVIGAARQAQDGSYLFEDPEATKFPARFYRVIVR
jgi:alpha-tubulin suppressor-like RCC1 family protein